MSGFIVGVGLVDGKGGAGVSSVEAGLEGIFEGEEIGDRKVTTELVGRSRPEGVRGRKSSSGSEKTERQSSEGEKLSVMRPRKRIKQS